MAAAQPPQPKFRHQTIDDKIEIGYGVAAADVDGDKKIDILLADKRQFVWYRNSTWEKFVIAEDLTKRDNVCLAAEDLDGDGKCELAVGGDWAPQDRENSGAVYYMIPPEDRTQKWEAVKLHAEPTVHRMRWMRRDEGGWGLVVAPLFGRGPAEAGAGSKILLYHVPAGDPRGEWRTETLSDSLHATHNFDLIQGHVPLVASRQGLVALVRNPENGTVVAARRPETRPAGEVRTSDQLVATVEPMHGNEAVVYADGQRHVLTDRMNEGHALAIDDAGRVVAGWRGKGGGVRMFTRAGGAWRETVVDDGGMACEDLCLADLDADGDPEIIASGRGTKNVKIYWNETDR